METDSIPLQSVYHLSSGYDLAGEYGCAPSWSVLFVMEVDMRYQVEDLITGAIVDRGLTLEEALMWEDQTGGYLYGIEPMSLVEPTNEEREEPS